MNQLDKFMKEFIINHKDEFCGVAETNACECGYVPVNASKFKTNSRKLSTVHDTCTSRIALNNHITFPSTNMLTDYDNPSTIYYDTSSGIPKCHWAMLLEIAELKGSSEIIGVNNFNQIVKVKFQTDALNQKFDWTNVKKGHVLAILYAERKRNRILIEDLDYCYVFNATLSALNDEAFKLLDDADLASKREEQECFGCAMKCESLSRCAKCKLAKYCSKECQAKSWKMGHKNICNQSEMLLRLASLPRHSFEEFFTFKLNDEHPLPPYVYSEQFVQKPMSDEVSKIYAESKPSVDRKCGLCGRNAREAFVKTGNHLTKTDCCDNWICDDEHLYVVGTYAKNSCLRNHTRYTLCNYHMTENHRGSWLECEKCKSEFDLIDYVDKGTNNYNFVKLKNAPKIEIKCASCGFIGDKVNAYFCGQTIRRGEKLYYCTKEKCKKVFMPEGYTGAPGAFLCQYMMQ